VATDLKIAIPDRLVTRRQLKELRQEVETILDEAVQGSIRKEQIGVNFGVKKPSILLQETMVLHDIQLNIKALQKLKAILEDIDRHAIMLRVVLSSEATPDVSAKIVRWFRSTMKQPVLLRFGIQPAIAGGCIVYTPNHRYDFTLRTRILEGDVRIRSILDKIK